MSAPLLATLERGMDDFRPTTDTVPALEQTFEGFVVASRHSTSAGLKDAILGQVAVMDVLRHRCATTALHRDLTVLMSRHAEALSWLHEESFDVESALFWLDRAAMWAQSIDWQDMVAFTFYRRSLLAANSSDDGRQVVELATTALRFPDVLPNVKGAAWEKISRGYAVLGDRDASRRAMDRAIPFLERPVDRPDNPAFDAQSVVTDDSLALRQSASWLFLGQGESVVSALTGRLDGMGGSYQRYHNNATAMLAMAHANAGQPDRSCELVAGTLTALRAVPSQSAWRDLHRTSTVLSRRWPRRPDVLDAAASVSSAGPQAAGSGCLQV